MWGRCEELDKWLPAAKLGASFNGCSLYDATSGEYTGRLVHNQQGAWLKGVLLARLFAISPKRLFGLARDIFQWAPPHPRDACTDQRQNHWQSTVRSGAYMLNLAAKDTSLRRVEMAGRAMLRRRPRGRTEESQFANVGVVRS